MRSSALYQFKEYKSKGQYRDIQIELDAVLSGDVDAINIKSSGSTAFTNNVVAKEARLGGICKIGGDCNIDLFEICGESKIAGNIISDKLSVDGKLKLSGKSIECREFNLSGTVTGVDAIKATIVSGKGGLILEKVESEKIDITFNKKTTLKEIIGKEINIIGTKSKGFIGKLFLKGEQLVEIDTIYGENIKLENIKAKLVSGHNIKIGENCTISKVEYTGEFDVNESSKVEIVLKK